MSQIIPTIPSLCPFTTWINTWNPFTSILPDRNTPLDLRPAGMDWDVFQDSLIGCWECPECIESGMIQPGVNDGIPVTDTIDLPDSLIENALEFQLQSAETWDTLCYSFAFAPIDVNFQNQLTIESTLQD